MSFLATNHISDRRAASNLVTLTHMWNEESPDNILTLSPSMGFPNVMISYNELSLTTGGNRVRIADLTLITFEAICTEGIRDKIKRIAVDANGYELVNFSPDGRGEVAGVKWPERLPYKATDRKWQVLVTLKKRNLLFDQPKASGRMGPLIEV
jgi:hypothetical protein